VIPVETELGGFCVAVSELTEKFRLWAGAELRPHVIAWDNAGAPDLGVWRQAAATGLFDLVPEASRHGAGSGLRNVTHALRGIARGSLDLPLTCSLAAHAAIGLDLLRTFGSAEQLARYLPRALTGECVLAICNSEESGGTDLRRIQSRFTPVSAERGRLRAVKSCATNASIAQLLLVSAVLEDGPHVATFLVEGTECQQRELRDELAGFQTGWTGRIQTDCELHTNSRRLGSARAGLRVFKRCFNWERLMMSAITCGVLEGLEDEVRAHLRHKESTQPEFAKNQYVQDKVVTLAATRCRLEALIDRVLTSSDESLDEFETELAVLKMLIIDEAFAAALGVFELLGYRSYLSAQLPQKILRDLMGLRFFGGTRELQKISLFNAFARELKRAPLDRPGEEKAA
jgi:isovaleryl-CoA dehydrogenase